MIGTDTAVLLLGDDGRLDACRLRPAPERSEVRNALRTRTAYAAAHVIPVPWADSTPGRPAVIDWDATLAYRRHVWSTGLGVADAMDTAQRNMGLDWAACSELIRRSAEEARSVGGALVVGVNTDQLDDPVVSLDRVVSAYLEQVEVAQSAGADVVVMASRHLARAASSAADYERVYGAVLARVDRPVILHWLGAAFDRHLAGYFGSDDWRIAAVTVQRIIAAHADHVAGIKMSLLDAEAEAAVRADLPVSARMFTGDDYHFVDLIEGRLDPDGRRRHSDALLGAFAAFPERAAAALRRLDVGDGDGYREILLPAETLARHLFAPPTEFYKVGIAFLSWLGGHQESFTMVNGLQSARSLAHLSRLVDLADRAGALERPDLAARRWNSLLALNGIAR